MKAHIKSLLILAIVIFTFTSAKSFYQTNDLLYINHVNRLKLLTIDNKCGEWGGDKKVLTIYRDGFNGQLLADYLEETKDCDADVPAIPSKSIKRIKLNQQDKNLIIDCLNELSSNKLNREDYPSHSGLFNQALLSDSSINIQDFPAKKWIKFLALTARLKNR